MRISDLSIPHVVTALAALLTSGVTLRAQTWSDVMHPDNPHTGLSTDARMAIPELFNDDDAVVELPVVVVLLEFAGLDHQPQHTVEFYQDFLFGDDNTGDWTSQGPSLKQIISRTSNGRLEIVPANETHGFWSDGIIGWVRTECPPGMSGYYCVNGDEDNQHCDPANPTACVDGGGHCAACDTFEYLAYKDQKMRAELIRLAAPYISFKYSDTAYSEPYDTMDVNWNPGADGKVTDNELAILFIHSMAGCEDHHTAPGHADWGSASCGGGTTRYTDPSPIQIDGINLYVQPGEIPEGGIAQVLAHEFNHHVFGLPDLYRDNDYNECNPKLVTTDGKICYPCRIDDENPEAACNNNCADAACIEDGAIWGADYVARGSTDYCSGSDLTSSCTNDYRDVWFTYTPTISASVTVTLDGDFDRTLGIFDGCNGQELAVNCTDPVQHSMWMTAGTTYWIRVAGLAGDSGIYELNIEGGKGTCDHPRDNTWEPQLADRLATMASSWTMMPNMTPWASTHLGFTRPKILLDDGTYTVHRAETVRSSTEQISQPEAILIPNFWNGDFSQEYFILENRAPQDWNGSSPFDEGIALWLVNEYPFPGDYGLAARRAIQLIRPKVWAPQEDSLWDGDDPDYYNLSAMSAPKNTHWADGTPSYVDIRNVSAAGEMMTVDIRLSGLFVDASRPGPGAGVPDDPWASVSQALSALRFYGRRWTIRMAPGSYPEDGLLIDTKCHLTTWGEGTAYIGQ